MNGSERKHPIDCEVGDYIIIPDVDGEFGEEVSPGVFRVSVEGPTGKKWIFQRWADVAGSPSHRWERID